MHGTNRGGNRTWSLQQENLCILFLKLKYNICIIYMGAALAELFAG